jgi:hypothetical protein
VDQNDVVNPVCHVKNLLTMMLEPIGGPSASQGFGLPSGLFGRAVKTADPPARLITGAVVAAIFGVLLPVSVWGARFPNAVERQIVFSGDAAVPVATLLGLSSSGASSISLQLGQSDAWAVYLLKHDTKKEITNGNGPARYNLLRFLAVPVASLTIGPYWLDLATQLPETRAGYYSFGSPFISEDLKSNDPWARLARRLKKEPGWNSSGRPQFQRCFTSVEKNELCVDVYGAKDYASQPERNGYLITITARR